MGRMYAEGIKESGLDIRLQIECHLRSNHLPSVPSSMVTPCIEAIEAVTVGEYDQEIELPEGVTYKGKTTAPAHAIVDQFHLDTFVGRDEYYYEED